MNERSHLHPAGPLGHVPTDAGKRMAEIITMHIVADREGNKGRWVAIRLSDGGSDGVVYDNVADAANSQLHYRQCAYVKIPGDGCNAREADVILAYHRKVYDAGNLPPYLQGVPLIVPRNWR